MYVQVIFALLHAPSLHMLKVIHEQSCTTKNKKNVDPGKKH